MNEKQKEKLILIKEKMKQREELLHELEESLTIRSLATEIPIADDERCAISWREVKGNFVLRIQNAAGETQEIPDRYVPRVIHRTFKSNRYAQTGSPRKRQGNIDDGQKD